MTKLTRIGQFAIKQQGAIGTAATIAAEDVKFEREQDGAGSSYTPEMNERNPQRSTLSNRRSVPGRRMIEHTGRTELKAGGGVAVPPDVQRLLQACNLSELTVKKLTTAGAASGTFIPGEEISDSGTKLGIFIELSGTTLIYAVKSGADYATGETITGSLSGAAVDTHAADPDVTAIGFGYVPVTPEVIPFTAYGWKDGTRYRAQDAMANAIIEAGGAGELVYANWTVTGVPEAAPDDEDEFSAGVVLSSEIPQPFMNGVLTVDGVSVCVDTLNFDLGNTISPRRCSSATFGVKAYRMSDRNPLLRIDPEAELEATFAFFSKFDAATIFDFFTKWGVAGRTCGIAAPQMVFDSLESGDRDGIETYPVALKPVEGNDYDYILFCYDNS